MAIQTVSAASGAVALSNSVRDRYKSDYMQAAMLERLYDQLAYPFAQELVAGSSVYVPSLSDMAPGTSVISETVDLTPQTLVDALTQITPTSRAEALQCSELLLLQAYTDYGSARAKAVGKNMMESIDLLARDAATKGDLVMRTAARSLLDKDTTGDQASETTFTRASTMLTTLKCPGFKTVNGRSWGAIMHPAVYHDVREDGNVVSIAQYQKAEIVLNHELGALGPFRLVVNPWAKVFGSAGADAGENVIATTLQTQAAALQKTISLATVTHLDCAMDEYWTIGTEETGSTHYPQNEIVRAISHATGIVTIVGEGANGGLRFTHASGTAVRNADHVYTIVFGGPQSLVKLYQPSVGEFGKMVGPKVDGLVDQFISLGWKFYGGYAILSQNRIVRAEVSASAHSGSSAS
jgi:N4-gp56 family major capsid protein